MKVNLQTIKYLTHKRHVISALFSCSSKFLMFWCLLKYVEVTEVFFRQISQNFRYLDDNPDRASIKNVWLSGMVAGAAVSLLSPVELIKIRSQMVTDGQRGPLAVIRELRASGGIFSKNGLFRGFTTQLARDPYGYRKSLRYKIKRSQSI